MTAGNDELPIPSADIDVDVVPWGMAKQLLQPSGVESTGVIALKRAARHSLLTGSHLASMCQILNIWPT